MHSDVCGPMKTESLGGKRFFVVFKDDYSKFRTVYFIKKKSEVVEKLKLFIAEAQTLGHVVKKIMTDNGTEYCNSEVRTLLGQYGIRHQTLMPYLPKQNGSSERKNRILVESARSMIHARDLPTKLWAEVVNTAAYVIYRTEPTSIAEMTPYELWLEKKAAVNHIKVFGSVCFAHIPKQKRKGTRKQLKVS